MLQPQMIIIAVHSECYICLVIISSVHMRIIKFGSILHRLAPCQPCALSSVLVYNLLLLPSSTRWPQSISGATTISAPSQPAHQSQLAPPVTSQTNICFNES